MPDLSPATNDAPRSAFAVFLRRSGRTLIILWLAMLVCGATSGTNVPKGAVTFQNQIQNASYEMTLINAGQYGLGVLVKYLLTMLILSAVFEVALVKIMCRVRWRKLGKAILFFLATTVVTLLVQKGGDLFFEIDFAQMQTQGPPAGYLWFVLILAVLNLIAFVSIRMEVYEIGVIRAFVIHLIGGIAAFVIACLFIVPGMVSHAKEALEAADVPGELPILKRISQ